MTAHLRRTLRRLAVCSSVVAITATIRCSDDTDKGSGPPAPPDPYAAMVLVSSAMHPVWLGSWPDEYSRFDEQPPMGVAFRYDFRMDTTEVTVGQYRTIMGLLPRAYGSILPDEDLPVCNVTWYDAVLFCNARSKAVGLDSVYTYASRDTAPDGTVIGLLNLQVRYDREGYRLPTEAEWVYAAQGSDTSRFVWGDSADGALAERYAWYSANSANTLHAVARKEPVGAGLYDLLGNALEWLNDVKVAYSDTPRVDYVGPDEYDGCEHVVKGGSHVHGIEFLRTAARSDNYESPANKLTRYLGFRCALGPIAEPTFGVSPAWQDTLSVVFSSVRGLSGITSSPLAKLVYVNRCADGRMLGLTDFTVAPPVTREYRHSTSCYLPTVSPDGNWVAYCTSGEGQSGPSEVLVHRLDSAGSGLFRLSDNPAYVPRWWVDPDTRDTFIVYASSTVLNSSAEWTTGRTRMVKAAGGGEAGTPVGVEAQGSWHGGLSADGRYITTGYPYLLMKDRTSGEVRTLFTGPANGKPAGDTSQVCNVSICQAPGMGDRALHLDFGSGGAVSTLTGTSYGMHECLFVTTYAGSTTHAIPCPIQSPGFRWDHPEWSNDPGFAVAGLEVPGGTHPVVVLFDLRRSIPMLAPVTAYANADLWHPYLWVSPDSLPVSPSLALDSLAMYWASPSYSDHLPVLARKAMLVWTQRDSLEVVFIGSSQVYHGIDPRVVTVGNAWVVAWGGSTPEGMDVFARDYVGALCPNVKAVVTNLVPAFMCMTPESQWYQRDSVFMQSVGYTYDRNHNFWRDSMPLGLVERVLRAPVGYGEESDPLRGFHASECKSWGAPVQVAGADDWTTADTQYVRRLGEMTAVADSLAARQIHWLVVAFPVAIAYRVTPYYGRYGPTRVVADSIVADMRRLEVANPFFHFYDANMNGYHDYPPSEAFDDDHLCHVGAAKLTARIDSVLQTVLP